MLTVPLFTLLLLFNVLLLVLLILLILFSSCSILPSKIFILFVSLFILHVLFLWYFKLSLRVNFLLHNSQLNLHSLLLIFKDKSLSLSLNYCRQSGLGYDKAESFNFGINKDF